MSHKFCPNIKKMAACFGLVFLQLNLQAQLPSMWVDKASSTERRLWFRFGVLNPGTLSKEQILTNVVGTLPPQSTIYPIDDFRALFSTMTNNDTDAGIYGFNIYIAAYDIANPGPLGANDMLDKQLVLVYAPAALLQVDTLGYWVIGQKDHKVYSLDTGIKRIWTENYVENIMKGAGGFISTLERRKDENLYMGLPSDTRSIYYDFDALKQFMDTERVYQARNNKEIVSGIQVGFSAYPDTGIIYKADSHAFKNRLILQFEFTRKNPVTQTDEVFYIDDEKDFGTRHQNYLAAKAKKVPLKRNSFTFDKGQLCPPNCPPPPPPGGNGLINNR